MSRKKNKNQQLREFLNMTKFAFMVSDLAAHAQGKNPEEDLSDTQKEVRNLAKSLSMELDKPSLDTARIEQGIQKIKLRLGV